MNKLLYILFLLAAFSPLAFAQNTTVRAVKATGVLASPSNFLTGNSIATEAFANTAASNAQAAAIAASLQKTGGTMTGNIAMDAAITVDGRDVSVDGIKLDTIEDAAKDDQTGAQIKALYEGEANAFTNTKDTKLTGITAGAEPNPAVVPELEAQTGTAITERTWTALRVKQAIDALGGGGGSSGGKIYLGAHSWFSYDTDGTDEWAHLNHELDSTSPNYSLEGTGLHTEVTSAAQDGRLKSTFSLPPGSTAWKSGLNQAFRLLVFADDDTDAKITKIEIFGHNSGGTYTAVLTDTVSRTVTTANVPFMILFDDSDITATMFTRFTIQLTCETQNSNCMWISGLVCEFE